MVHGSHSFHLLFGFIRDIITVFPQAFKIFIFRIIFGILTVNDITTHTLQCIPTTHTA